MPAKYSFGGLGNLFKCECGCSEFYLAEDVKPERLKVYECVNCHEWWVVSAQQKQAVVNTETLSTSDGVPPSAPAQVA